MKKMLLSLVIFTSFLIWPSTQQPCSHGDLRLSNGKTNLEGRLEVCTGGQWGTVCDDGFVSNDRSGAMVACRQLGFLDQGARERLSPRNGGIFGEGTGPIILDQVWCAGTERALIDCRHDGVGVHDCAHDEDIGVECFPYPDCTQGSVRLVNGGGTAENEGRVEVCVNQMWGTVSASDWGEEEATVVCRQLGFPDLGPALSATTMPGSLFDVGAGPILDIQCDGSEHSLAACTVSNNGRNYDHSNDAGVYCPTTEQFIGLLCDNLTTTSVTTPQTITTECASNSTTATTGPLLMNVYMYATVALTAAVGVETILLISLCTAWGCSHSDKKKKKRKQQEETNKKIISNTEAVIKMVACAPYAQPSQVLPSPTDSDTFYEEIASIQMGQES